MQTQANTQAKAATHVVVDERDGYTFWGTDREIFDGPAARAFAECRNAKLKPEHQSYRVYALVADDASPWQAGAPLAALFTAASDEEAAAIESAAVKAGLLLKCRECGCGVGCAGDTCQACGEELSECAICVPGQCPGPDECPGNYASTADLL